MTDCSARLAEILISIGAIKLRPDMPFKWASGYFMPIYNDNRLLLADPSHRRMVAEGFESLIGERGIEFDLIIGTSTAGISPATTLADFLAVPMMYARDKPKDHGMKNQLEGLGEDQTLHGKKALIYEDLISTGGSSMVPVEVARAASAEVTDLLSIFNYGLQEAARRFEQAGVRVHSLLDYDHLITVAYDNQVIDKDGKSALEEWRADPFGWGQKRGFPREMRSDPGKKEPSPATAPTHTLKDLLSEGGCKGRIFLAGAGTGAMKGKYYTIINIFPCEYQSSPHVLMAQIDIIYPPEEKKQNGRVCLANMLSDEVCDLTDFLKVK